MGGEGGAHRRRLLLPQPGAARDVGQEEGGERAVDRPVARGLGARRRIVGSATDQTPRRPERATKRPIRPKASSSRSYLVA